MRVKKRIYGLDTPVADLAKLRQIKRLTTHKLAWMLDLTPIELVDFEKGHNALNSVTVQRYKQLVINFCVLDGKITTVADLASKMAHQVGLPITFQNSEELFKIYSGTPGKWQQFLTRMAEVGYSPEVVTRFYDNLFENYHKYLNIYLQDAWAALDSDKTLQNVQERID